MSPEKVLGEEVVYLRDDGSYFAGRFLQLRGRTKEAPLFQACVTNAKGNPLIRSLEAEALRQAKQSRRRVRCAGQSVIRRWLNGRCCRL